MNFIKIFYFSFCSLCFSAEDSSDRNPAAVPPSITEMAVLSDPQPAVNLAPQRVRTLSPQDIIFLQGTVVALITVGSIVSILTDYGPSVYLATTAVIGYQLMKILDLVIFKRPLVRDVSLVAGTVATGAASLYSDVTVYPFVVLLTLAAQRGYDWSESSIFADLTDSLYTEFADFCRRLTGRKKND